MWACYQRAVGERNVGVGDGSRPSEATFVPLPFQRISVAIWRQSTRANKAKLSRLPAQQWLLPEPADSCMDVAPSSFIRRELPAQICHQLRDLIIAHAVLEGGHVAEIARHRLRDAVQDHLDQIIRHRAV